MLSSIQSWLKDGTGGPAGITGLNGLISPQMQALQAVVQPPVDVQDATNPIAYIWAADSDQSRMSAPRPIGLSKIVWKVDVAVMAGMDIDDPTQETAFPLLLDQIRAYLNTVAMPFYLTDAVTGFVSQIVSVGEKMSSKYARVRTTGPTGVGLVKFGAELVLTIEENVSYQPGGPYGP